MQRLKRAYNTTSDSAVSPFAPETYDAVWTVALGLRKVKENYNYPLDNFTRENGKFSQLLKTEIGKLNFSGISVRLMNCNVLLFTYICISIAASRVPPLTYQYPIHVSVKLHQIIGLSLFNIYMHYASIYLHIQYVNCGESNIICFLNVYKGADMLTVLLPATVKLSLGPNWN